MRLWEAAGGSESAGEPATEDVVLVVAGGDNEAADAIVDRLEAEATKREIKFPFRRAAAKRMVRWAIRRARKSI
jgi:hypothetical protein